MNQLIILGAGPSGLSTALFAAKHGIPYTVIDEQKEPGGSLLTRKSGRFLYDIRFRSIDPKPDLGFEYLRASLGKQLQKIRISSQIYAGGKLMDVPLNPMNVLSKLGPGPALDYYFGSGLKKAYGEKLFGKASPKAKLWPSTKPSYYPLFGMGQVASALVEPLGTSHMELEARVTRVYHMDGVVLGIRINDYRDIEGQHFVSTLPLPQLVEILDPHVPESMATEAARLKRRSYVVVFLGLAMPSVTKNAVVYFPEKAHPFSRWVEPKNLSPFMVPGSHTSLVLELPCDFQGEIWRNADADIVDQVVKHLVEEKWIQSSNIVSEELWRVSAGEFVEGEGRSLEKVAEYLKKFSNLKLAGQGGLWRNAGICEEICLGREMVGTLTDLYQTRAVEMP